MWTVRSQPLNHTVYSKTYTSIAHYDIYVHPSKAWVRHVHIHVHYIVHCTTIKSNQMRCWFLRRGKTGVSTEKSLGAEERTNKLNPLMILGPGLEPRLHWWKASALTTTLSLLPQFHNCDDHSCLHITFVLFTMYITKFRLYGPRQCSADARMREKP